MSSAWGEKVGSHLGLKMKRDFAVKKRGEELFSRWRNRKYKTQGLKRMSLEKILAYSGKQS